MFPPYPVCFRTISNKRFGFTVCSQYSSSTPYSIPNTGDIWSPRRQLTPNKYVTETVHDRYKRSSNRLIIPPWRQLQRNRKVMYQPYARPRMSFKAFTDPTRPLLMREEHPFLYNFDG
ncbi:hypothetical protein DINM_005558 [Dirofilaria immitis]|nr:hypothetical protein [Dirofilaria immitis]